VLSFVTDPPRRLACHLLGLVLLLAGCASPALQPTPSATQPPAELATATSAPTESPTAAPAASPTAEPTAVSQTVEPAPTPEASPISEQPAVQPLAVVVENSADARPQTGLDKADVVYETLAEGGISRFLAVFTQSDAEVLGPVRSLRHYFAFVAADYGASLVHIGASPQGFAWRDALGLSRLDESASDPGVWRARNRAAPHNAYTNTRVDRDLLAARGAQQPGSFGPLVFDPQAPASEEPATDLRIQFTPWPYNVSYHWDPETQVYQRSMEGRPHRDAATGEQLGGPTVVVQFAQIDAIANDPKLRVDINLAGADGQLLVFSQGTMREGRWQKNAPQEPTEWLNTDGRPLSLQPGQVWVEIVPEAARVTW
jgi:Protein of unknown function (DUF3048) N-terminal domain/Protein of unknown function (DUF3048) C-terminal domain